MCVCLCFYSVQQINYMIPSVFYIHKFLLLFSGLIIAVLTLICCGSDCKRIHSNKTKQEQKMLKCHLNGKGFKLEERESKGKNGPENRSARV